MSKNRRDYTKYSKPEVIQNGVKKAEEMVVGPTIIVEEPEVIKPTVGYVINCAKLNVRDNPYTHSKVLCTIERDSEVEIDEARSTEDFYKICTAAGIEGYCVKYFIKIKA